MDSSFPMFPSSFLYIMLVCRYPPVGRLCMACIPGLHDGVTVFSCWRGCQRVQILCGCSGLCPCLQSTYCLREPVQRVTASFWSGFIMSFGFLHLTCQSHSSLTRNERKWPYRSWVMVGICMALALSITQIGFECRSEYI